MTQAEKDQMLADINALIAQISNVADSTQRALLLSQAGVVKDQASAIVVT